MKKATKILYVILYLIAGILTLLCILSLFRNAESRYLKLLDFPRIQAFITSLIILIILFITIRKWKFYDYLIILGLIISLVINSVFLINYTTLVSVEVPTATEIKTSDQQLSLMLSNVEMSNRTAEPLLELIAVKKPDLILAMETDAWWNEKLLELKKEYPYSQRTINRVTYGMVLYSKYPLTNTKVNHLQNEKVPSFKTTIELPNGKNIILHCVHPVPPIHFKNLPDNEGKQDDALKTLGQQIIGHEYPAIVAGDLNDVVWSYVDELTGTDSILFDVRVGRGFYNSFNAENILMRWPLDHVFVTKEFRFKKIERLAKVGSDHFPILVTLVL